MSGGGSFSRKPLYLRVRDALAELIARGAWKPGFPVPSEQDLARQFGVSSGTMRKALEQMAAERLTVRRQGRGTFVADLAMRGASLDNLYGQDGERIGGRAQVVEIAAGAATAPERARLRLHDSAIYRIRRAIARNQGICVVEDGGASQSVSGSPQQEGFRLRYRSPRFGIRASGGKGRGPHLPGRGAGEHRGHSSRPGGRAGDVAGPGRIRVRRCSSAGMEPCLLSSGGNPLPR